LVRLESGFEPFALRQNFLRVLLVFPKLRTRDLLLDGVKSATLLWSVKENSELLEYAAANRRILLLVLQSR